MVVWVGRCSREQGFLFHMHHAHHKAGLLPLVTSTAKAAGYSPYHYAKRQHMPSHIAKPVKVF